MFRMCNQYAPSGPERVNEYFRTGLPREPYRPGIGPWGRGPFVRGTTTDRDVVVGQWALIGDNAEEAKSSARIMTNNARSESVGSKPTFRGPWTRGQRCLIPADSFLEPNWRAARTSGGAFAEPTAIRGDWRDFGTRGPT